MLTRALQTVVAGQSYSSVVIRLHVFITSKSEGSSRTVQRGEDFKCVEWSQQDRISECTVSQ